MGRASPLNAACLPGDEPVPTVQLAAAHDLSPSHLNKVLQCLVRAGILQSMSGLRGACRLARPLATISMLAVVTAVEGDQSVYHCAEIRQHGTVGEQFPKAASPGPPGEDCKHLPRTRPHLSKRTLHENWYQMLRWHRWRLIMAAFLAVIGVSVTSVASASAAPSPSRDGVPITMKGTASPSADKKAKVSSAAKKAKGTSTKKKAKDSSAKKAGGPGTAAQWPWERPQGPNNIISSDSAAAATVAGSNNQLRVWRGEGGGATPLYYSFEGEDAREIPGGARTANAPAVAWFDDYMYVFHRGTDNRVYYMRYDPDFGGDWHDGQGWTALPQSVLTLATPSVTSYHSHTNLMVTWRGTDSRMYLGRLDQNLGWHGMGEVGGNGLTPSSPAIAEMGTIVTAPENAGDWLLVAHRGNDNHVYLQVGIWFRGQDHITWNPNWHRLGDWRTNSRPSIATTGTTNQYGQVSIRTLDDTLAWIDLIQTEGGEGLSLGDWIRDQANADLSSAPTLYRLGFTIVAVGMDWWNHRLQEKRIW
ncbi:Rrf2 family transcriptional regulator [Streptomyces cadmiisoli]|uniref:Uncharacterized protein n=1 Tax=Streptomyces cadmiisoli TaxID=2184053 RepID=A0A2Z4JAA2_9ACTN|nr:Rrf2 family transcriptional regulator [Streptomyces cadmiisoli]AWW41999.1 hypothetical protein DN051_39785 [Streptomyces cadmiisoli]